MKRSDIATIYAKLATVYAIYLRKNAYNKKGTALFFQQCFKAPEG